MTENVIHSPLGNIFITVDKGKLLYLGWTPFLSTGRFGLKNDLSQLPKEHCFLKDQWVIEKTEKWLNDYFEGKIEEFPVPLDFKGTSFQARVWREMMKVPYGEVMTYGRLAQKVGVPRGYRAVANACKVNPYVIVVPCHRIIAANGIGGYNGGLEKKKYLLDLELENRKK